MVEELNPEEIKKTKEQIKIIADKTIDTISINMKKSDFVLLPSAKNEVRIILEEPNFFTPEELALINQKFKKGEIKSLSDIAPFIWKTSNRYNRIKSAIFNKEQENYLKEWMKQKVEETIAKTYWIKLNTLESEKRQKLRKLVKQYRITDNIIENCRKIWKKWMYNYWRNIFCMSNSMSKFIYIYY